MYAEGIQTVAVQDSIFHQCIAEAGTNFGGGGIELCNIQHPFTIESTAFISCESRNDAGGISAVHCPMWTKTCFLDCSFIGCSATPAADNDAGSLLVWRCYAEISCSNILFADSRSERRGGCSSYYIYPNISHDSTVYLFLFCFFKNGSSKDNTGNDAYFYDWKPTEPFFHCFSIITPSPRIYPSGHDNWLP